MNNKEELTTENEQIDLVTDLNEPVENKIIFISGNLDLTDKKICTVLYANYYRISKR